MSKTIKYVKYPNRRIYDTELSDYVPFSSIRKRIMDGDTIVVLNHKTKEDVTREVLISILLEQSVPGDELFTEDLMLMIIRFYGNPLQAALSTYLDQTHQMLSSLWSSFLTNKKDAE